MRGDKPDYRLQRELADQADRDRVIETKNKIIRRIMELGNLRGNVGKGLTLADFALLGRSQDELTALLAGREREKAYYE